MKGKSQGLRSKNVVRPGVRTGASKERIRPAGAAQIGQRQGNHITNQGATSYRGIGLTSGAGYPSKLGNEVAASTKCGPGGSRTIYKSGTMGQHGEPASGNPPKSKELFPGWSGKR